MKTKRMTTFLVVLAALAFWLTGLGTVYAALQGGSLDPSVVPKYASPLVKPPVMPRETKTQQKMAKNIEYYEIAVKEFQQQILPTATTQGASIPPTTVWSYGPANESGPDNTGLHVTQGGHYFYPAFTIEAKYNKPVRVKWMNELRDGSGAFRRHLLPVDPTLHWANPIGDRDARPPENLDDPYWENQLLKTVPWAEDVDAFNPTGFPKEYVGPVPIVTHLHGSHVTDDSDGYAEAWYLPPGSADVMGIENTVGSWYDVFKNKFQARDGQAWGDGFSVFQYPNDQRATTLWYHDHTLGMTRLNVYAGPAGFYLIRGGPFDQVLDSRTGLPAVLPSPRPGPGIDPFGTFYEIPIAIQDRSFNTDGSLFYPDNRAFFEDNRVPAELQIPFWGAEACDAAASDISPIWQPEFFGNMMVVNGQTWPFLNVEQRRYRLRLLNGCNSRFLWLKFDNALVDVYQIGAEGGFLPAAVYMNALDLDQTVDGKAQLLIALAERADVIVDFTNVPVGTNVTLLNIAPDEPFGGGIPGVDFAPADPASTGQVMQFRVVSSAVTPDTTTPPQFLQFPAIPAINPVAPVSQLSLNEEMSMTVNVSPDNGNIILDCDTGEPFGPAAALLGTYNGTTGEPTPLMWMDAITENPALNAVQTWEIFNFTADAHPIHLHLVQFQVVNRDALDNLDVDGIAVPPAFPVGTPRGPEAWETGFKDTVIAYPGEVTRVQAKFVIPRGEQYGLFVWHCHIVEHEDNEMMRPYFVGTPPQTYLNNGLMIANP